MFSLFLVNVFLRNSKIPNRKIIIIRSLKTLTVLSIVLVILLSFNRIEKKAKLDLKDVNVMAMLSEQELGHRPSHDYMFYVKTEINKVANA